MKANWQGSGIDTYAALQKPGDIGVGAENYHFNLLVCCPICAGLHVLDIPGSTTDRKPWDWDPSTLTLSPSVKVEGHRGICHWNLTNGEFIIHGDSTAGPRQ